MKEWSRDAGGKGSEVMVVVVVVVVASLIHRCCGEMLVKRCLWYWNVVVVRVWFKKRNVISECAVRVEYRINDRRDQNRQTSDERKHR